ncbi:hypothetical protein WJX84_005001 [Apatococcus fuscideae]|uniref:Cleft lip and palate associated transmembrane protein n=1 Tax=Apatococcus fuscideae TaxID=2026836 RepID=A0AAW1TA84_9CHLO
MAFYLAETPYPSELGRLEPIWDLKGIPLADTKEWTISHLYKPSKAVQNNGTLFLHVITHKQGGSADPSNPNFRLGGTFITTHPVVSFAKKAKEKAGMNLLEAAKATKAEAAQQVKDAEAVALENKDRPIISYFKPNLTAAFVDDFTRYPVAAIPPPIQERLEVDRETMEYYPSLFFNDFWILQDHLIPMNSTVTEIPMHISLSTMASWKWQIYAQMEQSFSMQRNMGTMGDNDSDEIKRVLTEGNPIFLALTFCVSLLHSVFDLLAFKNDIGFWRNKKSVEGLSVRSVLINCFCQVVIFLYLLDNDTSFVILASSGIGLLIEFWKVTKAMNVTLDRSGPNGPRLRFADKQGYNTTKTKQYDDEAMRYLSYVLYPCVAGYAVYALIYEKHTSWYSFILNSLVGAVYTFGFILMCPQLYINWRLKSVAHLPWRQMTYKFLNTIIDDLFAFVIKMPLLHRLSVFRDDLVFLVYIYQRWAYRVDKKRANEFGYSEEQPDEATKELEGAPAVTPQPAHAEDAPPASAAPTSAGGTADLDAPPGGHSKSPGSSDSFEDLGPEAESLRSKGINGGSDPPLAARTALPREVKKQQ